MRLSATGTAAAGLATILPASDAQAKSADEDLGWEKRDLVRVEIDNVLGSDRRQSGVILLKDKKNRHLPINVGQDQARSIRDGIARQLPPRPMTHDLMQSMLDSVGAKPDFVVVWQLHEMTFYAHYVFKLGRKTHAVDSRPSDAIALSVRSQTPIYVTRAVMDAASVRIEDAEGYEPEHWA